MDIAFSLASGQAYKGPYHDVDTRYNLCEPPPNLDPSSRLRIEQQAQSVACLIDKNRLLETRSNGSVQYSIQSPPVLTLARQIEVNYQKKCEAAATPYDKTKPQKCFEGNFKDELCLGNGTAFLIGKQLVLTAAHCICEFETDVVSRIKLTSFLVIFGFQKQASGHTQGTFDQKDVYHIDAVWNHVYKKNITDWAIVKLDREVEDRNLLTFGDSSLIHFKTQLYMLGHPLGLPLKLTIGAEVKEKPKPKRTDEFKEGDEPPLFDADLDAFAGNSGSPVFELEKGTIIAMLFAGNTTQFNSDDKTIQVDQISEERIKNDGYEKCLKITSINFIKTVLSSSFKMGHTHFSGRMPHLAKLKAHLTPLSSSTKVHILYGPGGVGKSELAVTFAKQNIEDFSFIWSISCGTEEEQWVGYQGLAKRLQISLGEKDTLHSLIHTVHRKLEQNKSKPWLLLFDNLQKDLPTHPSLPNKGGSIVITSYKSPKISSLSAEAILATEVLPLEFKEALEFLEKVTEKSSDDCKTLLTHVGCYPLVLGQVSSYIKQTKIEVEGYLAGLQKHQELLVTQGDPSKASGITLEAAFNMTLQQLAPHAKQWLFICSELNAALIPLSYLKAWLTSEDIPEEQPAIIAALKEHALLHYNAQEEIFSLHLEFQRILKSLAAKDDIKAKDEVARLLVILRDEWDFENTTNWGETMKKAAIWASHAEHVVEAEGILMDRPHLLRKLGRWEYKNGRYKKALAYHRETLNIRAIISVGKNHLDVASSLNIINEARRNLDKSDVAHSLKNIGTCYFSLGNYTEALKINEEALKIERALLGENHLRVATSLNNIGFCYCSLGHYAEALKVHEEALKIEKALLGENHSHVANSLSNIGLCFHSQGNYAEALKVHDEARKIYRATLGENHPHATTSLNNIGLCYYSQGKYTEALKAHEEALKIDRATLGENYPNVARSLNNIGSCYSSQRKYAEALRAYEESLKMYKASFGNEHTLVATTLNNIATCYTSQGNYTEALKVYDETLKIHRITLGENHPHLIMCLNNIGECYQSQENYEEALKFYGEALKINKANLGEKHPDVASIETNIGNCYTSLGDRYKTQGNDGKALEAHYEALKIRKTALEDKDLNVASSFSGVGHYYYSKRNYNEAIKAYKEALKIQIAALGENHPDVATCLNNIGVCYRYQGNWFMALSQYGEALKIIRSAFGENHLHVGMSLNGIATCYQSLKNYSEALKMYDQALKIIKTAREKNHPDVATILNNIANCYESQGNFTEALRYYDEVLKINMTALGENHPDVESIKKNIANCHDSIGKICKSKGEYTLALKYYDEALNMKKVVFGEKSIEVALCLGNIGDCYRLQKKYKDALKAYKETLKIKQAVLGENHPHVASNLGNIANCYGCQGNYNRALEFFGKALSIFKSNFGENHPDVKKTLDNIEICQKILDKGCAIS